MKLFNDMKTGMKLALCCMEPGTWVLVAYTSGMLARMIPSYPISDVLRFFFLCLVELLVFELLARFAMRRGALLRTLLGLVVLLLGVVYTAQLYSMWVAGGFVPPIAFANTETAGFIAFPGFYFMSALFLVVAVTAFVFSGRLWTRHFSRTGMLVCLLLLAGYAPLVYGQAPSKGMSLSKGESPISAFAHSFYKYWMMPADKKISAVELSDIKSEFLRNRIYTTGFPADVTSSLVNRPNVIVIFSEGLSARWIDIYGGKNPDVTPNIDALANGALVFKNYFGHSNATFRGLRGQLTSGHQELDGYYKGGGGWGQQEKSKQTTAVARVSISDILHQNGYWSAFYLSQQDYINKMLDSLGFDQVAGRDYLFNSYVRKDSSEPMPKLLSDRDLFSSMLKSLESRNSKQPFFAGMYNIQTHAFMDGNKKYQNGDNEVLNRFHSYDRDVGEFMAAFMASPLHENTVLVFTSDHATFPDPHARRADPAAQYFVDAIPLLIYWKGVEHKEFDLDGKNSLDLAPSLLSLLGIQHGSNIFLGCTFFEECELDRFSNAGDDYYYSRGNRIYMERDLPEAAKSAFHAAKAKIERYKRGDMVLEDEDEPVQGHMSTQPFL